MSRPATCLRRDRAPARPQCAVAAPRIVVIDGERTVGEAIASAIGAALPHALVVVDETGGRADVAVATWPCDHTAPTVTLLAAGATVADAVAAQASQPAALVSRTEQLAVVVDAVRLVLAGTGFVSPGASSLLAAAGEATRPLRFTAAEMRVLSELATRPDTRSRLANRLGVTTSTLDNHVGAIKRKVLDDLLTRGNAPDDHYLSMEALIGWATRQYFAQKT